MGPGWVPDPPGAGLNAVLNWRWFWHHEALLVNYHFALTSTNTSAFPRKPSLLPKHRGAESRAWGYDQPFLPHLLASPAPRCLQRIRQRKPRTLLTALLPSKAYREPWGAPARCSPRGWSGPGDAPTATGVTRLVHHTTLAENFSRGLIFRQVILQSSPCSSWGNQQAGCHQLWVRLASSGPFLILHL